MTISISPTSFFVSNSFSLSKTKRVFLRCRNQLVHFLFDAPTKKNRSLQRSTSIEVVTPEFQGDMLENPPPMKDYCNLVYQVLLERDEALPGASSEIPRPRVIWILFTKKSTDIKPGPYIPFLEVYLGSVGIIEI